MKRFLFSHLHLGCSSSYQGSLSSDSVTNLPLFVCLFFMLDNEKQSASSPGTSYKVVFVVIIRDKIDHNTNTPGRLKVHFSRRHSDHLLTINPAACECQMTCLSRKGWFLFNGSLVTSLKDDIQDSWVP